MDSVESSFIQNAKRIIQNYFEVLTPSFWSNSNLEEDNNKNLYPENRE